MPPINKHNSYFIMIISKNKFKNIIFDLGAVILNIDHSLTVNEFEELGIKNAGKLLAEAKQKQLINLFDKGLISAADFRNELRKYSHFHLDDYKIDEAWNAMLLDLPPARLQLLENLKTNSRTFLLSNTNEIHINAFHNYLLKEYGIADLSAYFEKTYLSFQLGMRKPDADIFRLILEENKLNPSETLFIDDTKEHIEGAEKLGIKTYWLDVSKESIADLFI